MCYRLQPCHSLVVVLCQSYNIIFVSEASKSLEASGSSRHATTNKRKDSQKINQKKSNKAITIISTIALLIMTKTQENSQLCMHHNVVIMYTSQNRHYTSYCSLVVKMSMDEH